MTVYITKGRATSYNPGAVDISYECYDASFNGFTARGLTIADALRSLAYALDQHITLKYQADIINAKADPG